MRSIRLNVVFKHIYSVFIGHIFHCISGMLRRGQPGLEATIFGLGLVASVLDLVLGLMQCWFRSHEGWPRGLVVSHRKHVIYVMSDTLLEELVFLKCNDC